MNRLIASSSVAAMLLLAAVFAGALWLRDAEELPRHNRTSSNSPAPVEDLALFGIRPEPTSSATRALELLPVDRYSGRWIGDFETNLFQPKNSAD
jgi:hypothetical protein